MFYIYYNNNKLDINEYGETIKKANKEIIEATTSYSKYKQLTDMEKTYFSLYNFMEGATLEEVKRSHVLNRTIYPISYFDDETTHSACNILFVFESSENIVCQLKHKEQYLGDIYFAKSNGEWKCSEVDIPNQKTLSCRDISLK